MTEKNENTESIKTGSDFEVQNLQEDISSSATEELVNQSIPSEEFDWDGVVNMKGGVCSAFHYSDQDRVIYEDMYKNNFVLMKENQMVIGKVVLINDREVVLNVGYKSDGIVPLSEFRDLPDLKVGDEVEAFVEKPEDKQGQIVLSRKKAKMQRAWEAINKALENDEIITGRVKSRTKGGLIIDANGIEAFLPGSQIDVKPVRDYDIYVGQTMEFKVVKINQEFRNVVVSHKILIEHDLESQKIDIIGKLEKGQILEGLVKNITSFGVFIDLGGVDGLLHITDMSWGRVDNMEDILKLDDKINVVVLDFDDDKKRISLGLKQLYPHPWDSLDSEIGVGSKLSGNIVTVADYGAFMEIKPGVEGLIHISEMSWSQHVRDPKEILKIGDKVDAVVLTIDRNTRKMSLGIKQLTTDPWEKALEEFAIGSKHKAIVRNMTKFGLFVEIKPGVDGLVHISDLSWSKKINTPEDFAKIGDVIEVVVLDIGVENRKLSLGHKQLEDNPWETFETIFTVGSVHNGTVVKKNDKGAIVMLPYGVEGFASNKHIVKEIGVSLALEEAADFKVIDFSKDSKKIILSHSKTWDTTSSDPATPREAYAPKRSRKTFASEDSTKSTLGDLGVLAELREKISSDRGDKDPKRETENGLKPEA